MSSKKTTHASKTTHAAADTTSEATQAPPPAAPPAPAVIPAGGNAQPTTTPAASSLAARVLRAVALVNQAKAALAIVDPSLSGRQVQLALKFRKGGEQFVPTLASLSARYGLEVPTRPTADMTASLQRATELEPLRTALGELSKEVENAYFAQRSETWMTAVTLYGLLKKAGKREPKIATALEPARQFFAYRHPLVAANHPKRKSGKAALAAKKAAAHGTEPAAAPTPHTPSSGAGPAVATPPGEATAGAVTHTA